MLFGSNHPMITPAKCLENLDALHLEKETRDLFLSGNAARVYQLEN